MNYARIIDGVAVDVSPNPSEQFHPDIAADFVPVPDEVRPQWRLVEDQWQAPPEPVAPEPEPELTWDNTPAEYWWIGVGAFFDRFGAKALAVTSSEDPVVKGLITLILPRKYVDLKREDLPVLMAVLVDKGLITEGDLDRILTAPTTDFERYISGLPQPAETD
jgi:hypothetical protein